MSEIEQKALSLHGRLRMAAACPDPNAPLLAEAADAIEQHEAFRQEVSDAVTTWHLGLVPASLQRFIIAKPDPLVEAFSDIGTIDPYGAAKDLRAALAARGLELVKKEPSQ